MLYMNIYYIVSINITVLYKYILLLLLVERTIIIMHTWKPNPEASEIITAKYVDRYVRV